MPSSIENPFKYLSRVRLPSLTAAFCLLLAAASAQCAPPRPRPYSGCGVLALRLEPGADRITLPFYQDPGVARFAEFDGASLPRLAGSAPEPVLAVSGRKGTWTRLAYDDAGREGWVAQARAWEYRPWREYLPGRLVRLLPGMKKGFYALKGEPGETGAVSGYLEQGETVRVLHVQGDWALIHQPSGWFRWRDGDGRLTLSLQ